MAGVQDVKLVGQSPVGKWAGNILARFIPGVGKILPIISRDQKIFGAVQKALPKLSEEEFNKLIDIASKRGTSEQKLRDIGFYFGKIKLGIPAPIGKIPPGAWSDVRHFYNYAVKTIQGDQYEIRFSSSLLHKLSENRGSLKSTQIMTEFLDTLKGKSSLSVQKVGSQLSIKWGNFDIDPMNIEIDRVGAIILKDI